MQRPHHAQTAMPGPQRVSSHRAKAPLCKGPIVREPHHAQAAVPKTHRETVPSCEVPSCKVPVVERSRQYQGPIMLGVKELGGRDSGRGLPCPHSVHSSQQGNPVLALEPISDPNRNWGGLAGHSWGEDRKSRQLHSSWRWDPVPGFPSPPLPRIGRAGESSRVHSAARTIQCRVFSSMWPQ